MSANNVLTEFRLYGCMLGDDMLRDGILFAIKNGWKSLNMLEFSASVESKSLTDLIIYNAQQRIGNVSAEPSKGLSVTVNTIV